MKDSFGNEIQSDSMIIRATEVQTFRNCRRKWMFESHNSFNLEPKIRNKNLRFGTAWHSAMETFYNNLHVDKDTRLKLAKDAMMVVLSQDLKDIEADLVHKTDADFAQTMLTEKTTEFHEFSALGKAMLEGYADWSATTTPPDTIMEKVETEHRVIVPLMTGVHLSSRVDGLVTFNSGAFKGTRFALEHKTASKSTRVDMPTHLSLDLQVGIELLTLTMLAEGTDTPSPQGALYNMARKQAPSSKVRNPLFGRHIVFRSGRELDNIYWQLRVNAEEMMKARCNSYLCYHNPQIWGGYCTWGCAFRDVCESMNRDEYYEDILEENFQQRQEGISEDMSNITEEGGD